MTTPTGNAISDSHGGASDWQAIIAGVEAGLGISAKSGNMLAQEAQAFGPNLDKANAQLDAVASDCMWPPSAQVTIPVIPGVYSQSFQIPCLLTYSEARALVGAGLILLGFPIFAVGISIVAFVAGQPVLAGVINLVPGKQAAAALTGGGDAKQPEVARKSKAEGFTGKESDVAQGRTSSGRLLAQPDVAPVA